jgi:hypothetical protein
MGGLACRRATPSSMTAPRCAHSGTDGRADKSGDHGNPKGDSLYRIDAPGDRAAAA